MKYICIYASKKLHTFLHASYLTRYADALLVAKVQPLLSNNGDLFYGKAGEWGVSQKPTFVSRVRKIQMSIVTSPLVQLMSFPGFTSV